MFRFPRFTGHLKTRPWFTINNIHTAMTRKITLNKGEQRLKDLLLNVSNYIEADAKESKPQLRFAGGWVRDKLLGTGSHDIDIAVDNMTGLRFAEYIKDFAKHSSKASKYGEDIVKKITKIAARPEQSKHLETATLDIFGLSIDIANLRKEVYDDISRNPQMEFGTAEEDALRRDSTINALFYNLQDESVEDLTKQGLFDMEKKIIRTPLDPFQTFKDDPLRILRCIRFASRLDFEIDESAVKAMAIPEIREALRVKITRERIGVEMEKIYKGPRVVQALQYIEDASLYPIVFGNPAWKTPKPVSLIGWKSAYLKLHDLIQAESPDNPTLHNLRQWLIVTGFEQQAAWVSASVVPYSPIFAVEEYKPSKKDTKTLAALVVREGLKADNKTRDTIDAAYSHVSQIIELKNRVLVQQQDSGSTNSNARPEDSSSPVRREELGMLLNNWGVSWRASVLAALLSELMQQQDKDLEQIVKQYHSFMTFIVQQDLLDAHELKPIVDGGTLVAAVGKKTGPWMKEAVRTLLEWQFKNPGQTDPAEGIEEVVRKYK